MHQRVEARMKASTKVKSSISLHDLHENSIQFYIFQFRSFAESLDAVATTLTVISSLVLLFRHNLIWRISSFLTYPRHL